MSSLRRLASYLGQHVGSLAGAVLCMVVLAGASAFYAFLAGPGLKFMFSGDIHDVLYSDAGKLRELWQWLPHTWIETLIELDPQTTLFFLPTLLVVVAVAKGIAQSGQYFLLGRIAQKILLRVRQDTFHSLLRLSPRFYDRRAHGDLLSRLTHDANIVEQAIFYGAAPLLRDGLSVVTLLAFCFVLTPKLALFTFISVPLAVVPILRFGRWLKRVSKRSQSAQGEINSVAYEALAGVRVVQAFCTERAEQDRLDRAAERYLGQMLRSYLIRAVRTPTMEILGMIAVAGLIAFLGYQVRRQGVDAAQFVSFFVAIIMMYEPLKKLGKTSDYLAAGSSAAERLFELIDSRSEVADRPGARVLKGLDSAIEFRRVSFSYREHDLVLRDFDLKIGRGETVALVGSTGCGKSTVAQLLPRFYDVTAGSIAIDGTDIRDLTLASLRHKISVVSQDTFLFNTSVRDNIAYGCPNASLDDIQTAAAAACADAFVVELPDGYDTVIGERGLTLSGGQRQRLAIARAILRDALILILDEATSALDADVERRVQNNLDHFMAERTSLVIAHRLSTVRNADRIAVIDRGIVAESGTHSMLLRRGGIYANLYALQFENETEENLSSGPLVC